MKDFLLLYRADWAAIPQPTAEQAAASNKQWVDWITSLATAGHLTDRGRQLGHDGRTLKGGGIVTNGPYSEIKETLGGFSILRAESYDAAVALAGGCPALYMGGSVEIRELMPSAHA